MMEFCVLKTGPEFDAIIDERVMGFDPGKTSTRTNIPPYSTSISAAWEVVWKMGDDDYYFYIEHVTAKEGSYGIGWDDHYNCHFKCSGNEAVKSSAPTAPQAICLAALKAHIES